MAIAVPVSGGSASVPQTDRRPRRPAVRIGIEPDGRLVLIDRFALLTRSFAYFYSQLRDESGIPLLVAEHHEEWADLLQYNPLLVLLAPRDHGKSYTVIAYLLWHLWKHNRDPWSGELYEDLHEGKWEGVLFSDTLPQAGVLFEKLQGLLLANVALFVDLMPSRGRHSSAMERWSTRQIRLRNGADLKVRGYRTSTRGLHPDMIILDDVLNDQNTLTAYQREKVWRYFVATLLPMNARQYILVGCLATGTPVIMADGTWRAIEQVKVGEYVWAVNTRGDWLQRRVDAVLDQGVAETVEVITDRATVRATPWHPFLVANGPNLTWRRADSLTVGDRVVEVKEIPGTLDYPWMTPDFCWLMGYLVGDGWVTSGRTSIWAALGVHEAINERVVGLLRDWMPAVDFSVVPLGPGKGGYVRGDNRPAANALASLGLAGKALTKRIPDWLFRAPPDYRREFLRGLCAADGTPMARSTDSQRIELANGPLVEDVRRLAMGSGIRVGRVLHRTRTLQPPNSPSPVEAESWSISLNFATVNASEGRHKHVGARAWKRLGQNARFGRVIEVRPSEPAQVWDLTVSGTHSFVADGLAVHNTALHLNDLLHRLRPDPKKPAILRVGERRVHFRWEKYRAVDWDTGDVLWPARHDLDDLKGRQNLSPILFAREFQNDPVDDASSLFPTTLTQPVLDRGAEQTFVPYYQKNPGEFTILGMDVAASAAVGADYTVLWVAAISRWTGRGQILWGTRQQGLGFKDQVGLLRMVCRNFDIDLGVIESNGFQKWLHAETQYLPETAGRLVPHRTGQEKADWDEGVPSVRLALENDIWTFPTGDEASRELGYIWQAEMHAFGWKDDKLQGVGEHDDTVMAWWFLDRARKLVEEWTKAAAFAEPEYVTGEDMGIEPVRIGEDF